MASKFKLATGDAETDPFLYGRIPQPFAWGFYDGLEFRNFWGEDCTQKFMSFLEHSKQKYIILMHNGGRFDAMYLIKYIDTGNIKIINGRIAEFKLFGHIIRDSLLILPMPLAGYKKTKIDYDKFEVEKREKNKTEILEYLSDDCVYLFDLVSAFYEKFGRRLTVGSAAINELKKFHPFERQGKTHDETFREYYHGGRVEVFRTGKIEGDFKMYDVNSMYPSVMKNYLHPHGANYISLHGNNAKFDPKNWDIIGHEGKPYFIRVIGNNRGAFPTKQKDNTLSFNLPYGEFFITSHEFKVAMEFGKFEPEFVHTVLVPEKTINFADFVDTFYNARLIAKESGDIIEALLLKFVLNSAYGKFATNPENFYDYLIGDIDDENFLQQCDFGNYEFYTRDESAAFFRRHSLIDNSSYLDVAIAASITGAARAILNRAIFGSKNTLMCDTDSLLCENLKGKKHATNLGQWKEEARIDTAYIAAKKMYALFQNGDCVKSASKGVRITPKEIVALVSTGTHTWQNSAPTFSLKRTPNNYDADNDKHFIERKLVFPNIAK